MKRIKKRKLNLKLILAISVFCLQLQNVYGVQAQTLGALIQTTTFQTDFEGLVYLNLMENKVLGEADSNLAGKNIKDTFVVISMNGFRGSGNVFDIKKDEIIIISNRHVLQYWDEDSYVTFMDGRVAEGVVLYLSEESDVGFLRISTAQFGYEELVEMRSVRKNPDYYEILNEGDSFLILNITSDIYKPEMHQGTIVDKDCYIPDFDTRMIYTKSYGKPGMSGSGMFDAKGAYIGMVTAGTSENELVGIRLPDILAEYEKAQKNRPT